MPTRAISSPYSDVTRLKHLRPFAPRNRDPNPQTAMAAARPTFWSQVLGFASQVWADDALGWLGRMARLDGDGAMGRGRSVRVLRVLKRGNRRWRWVCSCQVKGGSGSWRCNADNAYLLHSHIYASHRIHPSTTSTHRTSNSSTPAYLRSNVKRTPTHTAAHKQAPSNKFP
jgi:hypothetical protein